MPDDITNKEAISEMQWLVDSYKSCIKIQKACELSIRALSICDSMGWLNSEEKEDEDDE
jgi:hypothetical protein